MPVYSHITLIFLPTPCLGAFSGNLREALQRCFSAPCKAVTCQVLHQMKLLVGLSTSWVARVPAQGHCQVAVDFLPVLHRVLFIAGALWHRAVRCLELHFPCGGNNKGFFFAEGCSWSPSLVLLKDHLPFSSQLLNVLA